MADATNPFDEVKGAAPWATEATLKGILARSGTTNNYLRALVKKITKLDDETMSALEDGISDLKDATKLSAADLLKQDKKSSETVQKALRTLDQRLTAIWNSEKSIGQTVANSVLGLRNVLAGGKELLGQDFNAALTNAANKVTLFGSKLNATYPNLGKTTMLLGLLAGVAAELFEYMTKQNDVLLKMYSNGLLVEHGFAGLADAAAELGLSAIDTAEMLTKFSNVSVALGVKNTMKMMQAIYETSESFGEFKMSIKDGYQAVMDTVDTIQSFGIMSSMTDQQRNKFTKEYILELNELAEQTGKNRDEIRKQNQAYSKTANAWLTMQMLPKEVRANFQKVSASVIATFGPAGERMMDEIGAYLAGGVGMMSKEYQLLFTSLGRGSGQILQEMAEAARTGDVQAMEKAKGKLVDMIGEMTPQQAQQLKLMAKTNPALGQLIHELTKSSQAERDRRRRLEGLTGEERKAEEAKIAQEKKDLEVQTTTMNKAREAVARLQDEFMKIVAELTPILIPAMRTLADTVIYLSKIFKSVHSGIASFLEPFLGSKTAGVGAAISSIMLLGIMKQVFGLLVSGGFNLLTNLTKKVFTSIGGALLRTLGMSVGGVAGAAIGGIKGIAGISGIKGLGGNIFGGIVSGITKSLSVLTGSMKSIISGVIDLITNSVGSISKLFPVLSSGLAKSFSFLSKGLVTSFKTITQGIGSVIQLAISTLSKAFQSIFSILPKLGQGLSTTVSSLSQGLVSALKTITQGLGSIIQTAISTLSKIFQSGSSILPNLAKGLSSIFQTAVSTLSKVFQSILNILPKFVQGISKAISSLSQGLVSSLKTITQGLGSVIQTIFATLSKTLRPIIDLIPKLAQGLSKAMSSLSQGLAQAFKALSQGLGSIIQTTITAISRGFNSILDILPKLGKNLGTAIEGLSKGIGQSLKFLSTGIGALIKSIGESIGALGKGIGKGVGAAVEGILKGTAAGLSALSNPRMFIGAAVLAAIAGAAWVAGKAFQQFEQVSWEGMAKAGVAITGLGLAAAAAGVAAPLIVAGGLALGVAIGAIGAGLAGATWLLGKALPTLADGIKQFAEIDGTNLKAVGLGMVGLGAGLVAMTAGEIISGIGALAGGFLKLFTTDPVTKLKRFAEIGPSLNLAANALEKLADAFPKVTMSMEGFTSVANFFSSGFLDGIFGRTIDANKIQSFIEMFTKLGLAQPVIQLGSETIRLLSTAGLNEEKIKSLQAFSLMFSSNWFTDMFKPKMNLDMVDTFLKIFERFGKVGTTIYDGLKTLKELMSANITEDKIKSLQALSGMFTSSWFSGLFSSKIDETKIDAFTKLFSSLASAKTNIGGGLDGIKLLMDSNITDDKMQGLKTLSDMFSKNWFTGMFTSKIDKGLVAKFAELFTELSTNMNNFQGGIITLKSFMSAGITADSVKGLEALANLFSSTLLGKLFAAGVDKNMVAPFADLMRAFGDRKNDFTNGASVLAQLITGTGAIDETKLSGLKALSNMFSSAWWDVFSGSVDKGMVKGLADLFKEFSKRQDDFTKGVNVLSTLSNLQKPAEAISLLQKALADFKPGLLDGIKSFLDTFTKKDLITRLEELITTSQRLNEVTSNIEKFRSAVNPVSTPLTPGRRTESTEGTTVTTPVITSDTLNVETLKYYDNSIKTMKDMIENIKILHDDLDRIRINNELGHNRMVDAIQKSGQTVR